MPDGSIPAFAFPPAQNAPVAAHPDFELIRLCAEFQLIERQWDRLEEQSPRTAMTPEMDELALQQKSINERLVHLGCHTLEGLRALAGVLHDADITRDDPTGGAHDRLPGLIIRSLLRGVDASTGLLNTTAHTAPASDTVLLAACAQFDRLEQAWLDIGFDHHDDTPEAEAAQAERDRLKDLQAPLLAQIEANPPTTVPGFVAVARSLALWDAELLKVQADVDTTGPVLTAILVRGLLAADQPSIDADLLRLCSEFMAIHERREDQAEGPNAIADDDAFEVVNNAATKQMASLVGRMEAVPPRSEAGVQAVLRCLAACGGHMDCSFDAPDTINHKLLRLVLLGVPVLGTPAPCPDTELLALRPEYDRIMKAYDAANRDDVPWADVEDSGGALNDFCDQVAGMPAAVTREGRALQAICALRQLSYFSSCTDGEEPSGSEGVVWKVLAQQVDGLYPLPGAGVKDADPVDTDAPLLALQPELEKLHEELRAATEKKSGRGGKKATRRRFDQLITQAIAMPKARTAEGLAFQQRAEWLAQDRGVAPTSQAQA